MSVLSRIARDWAARCFGEAHVKNFAIRSLRTLEESIELAQALNVSRELAHKAVDEVYNRPVGDPEQEMGGVLHTMNILCESWGVEPDEIAERELRRCLKKSPEHFAKRNQEKLDMGLDVSAQSSDDFDIRAAKLYQHHADNHPTIQSNRFPPWSNVAEGDKDVWRRKAQEPIDFDRRENGAAGPEIGR